MKAIKNDSQKISRYINDLASLPEPRKTLIEIIGANRSEVHIAKLLAYFFKTSKSHGLGTLFINALLNTKCYSIDSEITDSIGSLLSQEMKFEKEEDENSFLNSIHKVEVEVEEKTDNSSNKLKRIDLLLTTEKSVVCIEFKINHELDNPLEVYQNHIEEKYCDKEHKFFIVLTPYKKEPSVEVRDYVKKENGDANRFTQMILKHFIDEVKKKLPFDYFVKNANEPSLIYLTELIQTIRNREVRFKRSEVLMDLNNYINQDCEGLYINKGGKGGFIQVQSKGFKFKIRIINKRQFRIEKWSLDNERIESLPAFNIDDSNHYETVKGKLKEIMT